MLWNLEEMCIQCQVQYNDNLYDQCILQGLCYEFAATVTDANSTSNLPLDASVH